jgi:hypothetical protein
MDGKCEGGCVVMPRMCGGFTTIENPGERKDLPSKIRPFLRMKDGNILVLLFNSINLENWN